ncbi:MAG: hypothetical protein SFY67_01915 [Candidatus Melainabacteria bacterium]|nr:hypothetical protein [Candidatus Melainabacteria bacterium]
MQIKLTDKAREALLLAELVAWAKDHAQVEPTDLLMALCEQHNTAARAVFPLLMPEAIDFETRMLHRGAIRESAPLHFTKIPLSNELQNALEAAALENLQLDITSEISTGALLIGYLFQNKDFLQTIENHKLGIEGYKYFCLELATRFLDTEIEAGKSVLSEFKRKALNWLRDDNLTEQIKRVSNLTPETIFSKSTISKFLSFFIEDHKLEEPAFKPPLTSGIKEKARRDLEIIDSYVSAKNLPDPEHNMLGMYVLDPSQFLLFFEKEMTFVFGDSSQTIEYDKITDLKCIFDEHENKDEKAGGSLAITYGGDKDLEIDIIAKTNDVSDVFALHNFLLNAIQPQIISEINDEQSFNRFLNRQENNMSLHHRLSRRIDELWELGWWENEKGAEHIMLLRLLAILSTLPLRAVKPSASGLY